MIQVTRDEAWELRKQGKCHDFATEISSSIINRLWGSEYEYEQVYEYWYVCMTRQTTICITYPFPQPIA